MGRPRSSSRYRPPPAQSAIQTGVVPLQTKALASSFAPHTCICATCAAEFRPSRSKPAESGGADSQWYHWKLAGTPYGLLSGVTLCGIMILVCVMATTWCFGQLLYLNEVYAVHATMHSALLRTAPAKNDLPATFINSSAVFQMIDILVSDRDRRFLVVDGDLGSGKRTAVVAAVRAVKALGIPVVRYAAKKGDTLSDVLRGLFGLHIPAISDVLGSVKDHGPFLRALWRLLVRGGPGGHVDLPTLVRHALMQKAQCGVSAQPGFFALIYDLLQDPSMCHVEADSGEVGRGHPLTPSHPPVLLLKVAHVLTPAVLADVLDLARELAAKNIARFVLVFKRGGSLASIDASAAEALRFAVKVTVDGLSSAEASTFLQTHARCSEAAAEVAVRIVGGQLHDLHMPELATYCAETNNASIFAAIVASADVDAASEQESKGHSPALRAAAARLENILLADTEEHFKRADKALHWPLRNSCRAACAVKAEAFDNALLKDSRTMETLTAERIMWWSLRSGSHVVTRPLVLRYMERHCACDRALGPGSPGLALSSATASSSSE